MLESVTKQSLFENSDENKEMEESNWDNDFVLQLGLIPKTLIKIKTAKNILFIGRCVRVIQASQGVLGPVCKLVNYINTILANRYSIWMIPGFPIGHFVFQIKIT